MSGEAPPNGAPRPPFPVLTGETAPFWNSAHERALRLPRCHGCGQFFFPPARFCPNCWGDDVSFDPVSGRGSIISFVTFQRLYHPAFERLLPYDVGVIELEEGPRFLTRIVGRNEGHPPEVSSPVEVCYEDLSPTTTLPLFRVVGPEPPKEAT